MNFPETGLKQSFNQDIHVQMALHQPLAASSGEPESHWPRDRPNSGLMIGSIGMTCDSGWVSMRSSNNLRLGNAISKQPCAKTHARCVHCDVEQ